MREPFEESSADKSIRFRSTRRTASSRKRDTSFNGTSRSESRMADYFSILAAITLGIGILTTQILFGGYGFLIFSLPGFFLVGLAAIFAGMAISIRGELLFKPTCLAASILLALYVWWRNSHTENLFPAINIGYLFFACSLTYLVLVSFSKPSQCYFFWGVVLVAALAQSSVALIQILNNPTLLPMGFLSVRYGQWMQESISFRATGFHVNPNALAWTLNIAALVSLSAAWWSRWNPIWKVLLFYIAIVSLVMSIFTVSRGGILALIAGAVVLILISLPAIFTASRRQGMRFIWVAGSVFVLVGMTGWMVYLANPAIQDRFHQMFQSEDRIQASRLALRIFLDHPIIGVGPGGFVYETRRFWTSDWWDFAHNDWAQLLSDYGWIGFSFLMIFLVLHMKNGLTECQRLISGRIRYSERGKSNAFALIAASMAILAMAMTHSFFDFNTQISGNALLLAAALGGIAQQEKSTFSRKGFNRSLGVLLCLGGIGMVYAVTWIAPSEWYLLQADNAIGQGLNKEAMAAAQKGLTSNPDNARLWFMKATASQLDAKTFSNMDDYLAQSETSAKALQVAMTLEPDEVTYALDLLPILDVLGHSKEAEVLFWSILSRSPYSGKGYLVYAQHLQSQGQIRAAARYYRIATRLPGTGKDARQQLRELAPLLKRETSPPPVKH